MNPIQIAAILGLFFSLPVLFLSFKRIHRDKDLLSVILTLIASLITATFVSAYFHDIDFIVYMVNPDNLDWYFNPWLVGIPLTIAALLLDGTMYVCVKKITQTNLWKSIIYLLLAFIGVNILAGIGGSLITSYSFDQCFFGSCCASMGVAGFAWGLTYKEICVVGNIYFQTSTVLLSTLYVIWMAYRRCKFKTNIGNFFLMLFIDLYGFMMIGACLVLINHYTLPLNEAYDLCYKELILGSRTIGVTYNVINYYIFIIGFLVLVIGNILLGRLMRISHTKRDLHKINFGEEPLLKFADEII